MQMVKVIINYSWVPVPTEIKSIRGVEASPIKQYLQSMLFELENDYLHCQLAAATACLWW